MKIAVPYENGQVFQNFGHSAQFKIQDTETGKILSSEIVSTNAANATILKPNRPLETSAVP